MKNFYETVNKYIRIEKVNNITDSVVINELPVYDNGFNIEEVVKQLIWFLRADDNLTWIFNRNFMEEVGWEKRINHFSPMEDETSLRFYLNEREKNSLNLVVTQSKVDLLEEAPYWLLYFWIFQQVILQWCRKLGWDYEQGVLVYNFVDSFIVADEGEAHLPVFDKGWVLEVSDKHPQTLKVDDFKVKKS